MVFHAQNETPNEVLTRNRMHGFSQRKHLTDPYILVCRSLPSRLNTCNREQHHSQTDQRKTPLKHFKHNLKFLPILTRTLKMAIFNFHGKSKVNLSTADNDNNYSQADVQTMLTKIISLEERVEGLLRNQKPCNCGSQPSPQNQPSLFTTRGTQSSLFGRSK